MYFPTFDLFQKKANEGKIVKIVPIYREILADKETPISIFLKIGKAGNAFLLENAVFEKERRGRYSFIGVASRNLFRGRKNMVEIVENGIARKELGFSLSLLEDFISTRRPVETYGPPRFNGAIGYMCHDISGNHDIWDSLFILADTLIVYDNFSFKIKVVVNASVQAGDDLQSIYNHALHVIDRLIGDINGYTVQVDHRFFPPEEVIAAIPSYELAQGLFDADECMVSIGKGRTAISSGFEMPCGTGPFDIYRNLRTAICDRCSFYLTTDDFGYIALDRCADSSGVLMSCPSKRIDGSNGVKISTFKLARTWIF